MSDLYALQGKASCGKSVTLKNVIQLLTNKYPKATVNILVNGNTDQKVVFANLKGLTVGIETQGDPLSRLQDSLPDFMKMPCDIIFCACRTRGMTVEWVKLLSNKYSIHFVPKARVSVNQQKVANLSAANALINLAGL